MAFRRTHTGGFLDIAPRPKEIPKDISDPQSEARDIFRFKNFEAMFLNEDEPMGILDCLKVILWIEQQNFNLNVLGNAFTPRNISIQTTPTLIFSPNKVPRGYILLNPNQPFAAIGTVSLFALAARAAGTFLAPIQNVSIFGTSRFFLQITVAPGTMTVDIRTVPPVLAPATNPTAQANIFAGFVGPGQQYIDAGEIGTDQNQQVVVTTTVAGGTWGLDALYKPAGFGMTVPPTIFLGNQNVTTNFGKPLLGGQEIKILLADNTPLFGIATQVTNLKVFELQ